MNPSIYYEIIKMMQWEQAKGHLNVLMFLSPELSENINNFITVTNHKIIEDFTNAKKKELDTGSD